MADLKTALSGAGLTNSQTLLQSGNIVLESNADPAALTDIVEATIETSFGFHSHVIVRTDSEIAAIVEGNPYEVQTEVDPRMVHVMFFKTTPVAAMFDDLRASHEGSEEMTLVGGELFLHYPDGSGRSRLSGSYVERYLTVPGTARNWNTVLKINEALKGGV